MTETFAYDAINHQVTHETFNYATVSDKLLGLSTTYSHSGTTANMVTSVAIRQTSASDNSYAGTTLVGATYGYDDAGRVSSVTSTSTANGTTTTFGYGDGTGAMSTVSTAATSGDIVTTYHYNATNGHLESIVTMQGSTIIYEEDNTYPDAGDAHYDQITRQQVTALVTNGTSSPTTQQYYVTYTYDSQNQLTSMVTTSGAYGSTESHSTLASETFTYDALGNRTYMTSGSAYEILSSDSMNQEYNYYGDGLEIWRTYDSRGNVVNNSWEDTYTYDALNRLVTDTPEDGRDKAVYTYDSENRRTSETLYAWDSSALGGAGDWSSMPASVTDYLYNGQTLMAEVYGLTGKMIKSYQWDPTKPNGVGGLLCITTYDSSGNVTGQYKPVYDSNANVVALIDLSSGNVVANYSYTAFGICTATGPMADVCNFRFGGMYWQASSGLYYDHARDYDPFWGRFVERDPSGVAGGVNEYEYGNNNTVTYTDPTGDAAMLNLLTNDNSTVPPPAPPTLPPDSSGAQAYGPTPSYNPALGSGDNSAVPPFGPQGSILTSQQPYDGIVYVPGSVAPFITPRYSKPPAKGRLPSIVPTTGAIRHDPNIDIKLTSGQEIHAAVYSGYDFQLLLEAVLMKGQQIADLEIRGHGSADHLVLGANGFSVTDPRAGEVVLTTVNEGHRYVEVNLLDIRGSVSSGEVLANYDITDLMKRVMAPDSTIGLNGCHTAQDPDLGIYRGFFATETSGAGLAGQLSLAVPQSTVTGFTAFTVRVPFTTTDVIGDYRSYVRGSQSYTAP